MKEIHFLLNNLLAQKNTNHWQWIYIQGTVFFFLYFQCASSWTEIECRYLLFYMYDQKLTLGNGIAKTAMFATRKISRTFQRTYFMFKKYFSCLINEKLLKQFNLSRDVSVSFYFSRLITKEFLKQFNMFRDAKQICQHSFSIYGCSH